MDTQKELGLKEQSTEVEAAHAMIPDGTLQLRVRIVDVLSNYTIPGLIFGFTPGEVAILVDEPMSDDRTVAVHLDSCSFEGQVLYCAPYENRYETHISIDDTERTGLRRAPRFPVTVPAELILPEGDPVAITIRDISRDGMGLESPLALRPGQPVAISSAPAFVFAVVRHCEQLPEGKFRAGVEMHHLFERPVPPSEPAKPTVFRALRETWFLKTCLKINRRALEAAE
jgi:PilZ domain